MTDRAPARAPRVSEHRPWVTNAVLLVIVLVLGVWVILGEPETRTTSEALRTKTNVFQHFRAQDMVKIDLTQGGETVKLQRAKSGGTPNFNVPTKGWMVAHPVQDHADDAQINRILNKVQYLRAPQVGDDDLADYVFGDVTLQATFTRESGPAFVLTLGAPRPGKVVPLRIEGREGIYHVGEDLLEELGKELWMLRNKQLNGIAKDTITGVVVERRRNVAGPGADRVVRTELLLGPGGWRHGKDGDFASRARVHEVIDAAAYFRATGIVKDEPTAADLKRYGLDDPWARLTFTSTGDVKTSTLEIGAAPEDSAEERFVRLARRPGVVYRANITGIYETLERNSEDFLELALFPIEGGEAGVDTVRAVFADGRAFKVKNVENDWLFEADDPQLAKNAQVGELVKALLALRIRERLDSAADPALGLDEPELTIELSSGDAALKVLVGAPRPGQQGVYAVCRTDDAGQPTFAYEVSLADMPARLGDAPLELRDPTILKVYWDVTQVSLLDRKGKKLFGASYKDPDQGQNVNALKQWFVDGESRGTDHERFKAFLKTFEALLVDRWVALDTPDARRDAGLDEPTRLVFRVEKHGQPATDVVLLLGSRTGDSVHALRDGAPAIGLLNADFFDRLTRGFATETVLFKFNKWDALGLKLRQEGKVVLDAVKTEFWKRDGRLVANGTEIEDLIEGFERIGITRVERAVASRLEATRLKAPPLFQVEIRAQNPASGKVTTHTLAIGTRAGLNDQARWATVPGTAELGSWFDAPLRAIERYIAENPPPDREGE